MRNDCRPANLWGCSLIYRSNMGSQDMLWGQGNTASNKFFTSCWSTMNISSPKQNAERTSRKNCQQLSRIVACCLTFGLQTKSGITEYFKHIYRHNINLNLTDIFPFWRPWLTPIKIVAISFKMPAACSSSFFEEYCNKQNYICHNYILVAISNFK